MDIKAELNNIRISPRKVRLVIDVVRGKSVKHAETQLTFMNKAAASPVLKLLRSAVANAKNNFDLKTDSLYLKSIVVNEGRTLKRYMPRAYGRADVIRKRSSHILLVLAEIKEHTDGEKNKKTSAKNSAVKNDKKTTKKKPARKVTTKKAAPKNQKKSEASTTSSKSSKK